MSLPLLLAVARQCEHLAAADNDLEMFQGGAYAGSPDAFAGCGLEHRAVIGAHEITAINGKKLVVHPIQTDADVRTTVGISEQLSFVVDQHRLEIAAAAAKSEFLAFAVAELAHARDEFPFCLMRSRGTHA